MCAEIIIISVFLYGQMYKTMLLYVYKLNRHMI